MSNPAKMLLAFCVVAVVAACAPREQEVVFIEEPIVQERVSTKF